MNKPSHDAIEQAYCFIHQKLRVYEHSRSAVQRDDIEYAISQYVQQMDATLYAFLSSGNPEFLLSHPRFEADMRQAQEELEEFMNMSEE